MKKIVALLCVVVALWGCSQPAGTKSKTMVVSILPLQYIVENIVGDDFAIETIVPPGASPETYEPTPAQMEQVERAEMIFAVGVMGFEQATVERMSSTAQGRYVALAGIAESHKECVHHDHSHGEHHHHGGVNPHLWTSPDMLMLMAERAYNAISAAYPDSTKYTLAYKELMQRLCSLDSLVAERCAELPSRAFVIYHPTFQYLADRYGLTEIAIENHGKEPSVDHLRKVVDRARELGARKVFYQREFPRSVVATVASELGVEAEQVDILSADVEGMIVNFVDKLQK